MGKPKEGEAAMADTGPVIVQGRAGQPITLPLSNGPATGYSWVLDLPGGVVKIEDGPGKPAPPGQQLGSSSGAQLRVTAAKGRYRITAKFIRPWQPDAPIDMVVIDLTVD
jgi:predicted secreted protein